MNRKTSREKQFSTVAAGFFSILTLGTTTAFSQNSTDAIRLNQVGFYPGASKVAVVVNTEATKFFVIDENKKDTAFQGTLKKAGKWEYSDEVASQADFSGLKKEGTYHLYIPGVGNSHSFEVNKKVHHDLGKASVKAFYYQRASTPIQKKYAGKFARKEGHPDTVVYIHPSAQSDKRPAGSVISSPGGWYDAGDYNKYIVNSGISTYTLLAAYEHNPEFFDTLKLNIPESGNKIPDVLDEALYNIKWMLTMQDADGGVYHKLTNPNFDGFVMPDEAINKRYVVQKTTAATLNFAAVMAQAARVFSKYKKDLPKFSEKCLYASKKAMEWATKNPSVLYDQAKISENEPAIVTGAYDDQNVADEFQWANIELFVSTGDLTYYKNAKVTEDLSSFQLPNWQSVNTLGLISLSRYAKTPDHEAVKNTLIKLADSYKNHAFNESAFGVPMGQNKDHFTWGSNSCAANQGVILLQAYSLTKNKAYLNAAIASLDYLLGRNGTGYSYVTGFGDKPTMHPHHRPSEADGIAEPIPGFLAGGPNPQMQDKNDCPDAEYTSTLPAKAYLDHVCSYASNEIAINWNAPLAYLTLSIEALMNEKNSIILNPDNE
jgi:endoglucanase